jgi:iron(III) transport system permease protein
MADVAATIMKSLRLSRRWILILITLLVLLYGIIYPNLFLVKSSLQQDGHWTLANYFQVFSQRVGLEAMATSIVVSALTVALCVLVGIPLAFLFERYTFPGRNVFATLAALPLVLLGWHRSFHLSLGESGILARAVQHATSGTTSLVAAWLGGITLLSYVHDVPVLLRSDWSGTTAHR